MVGSHRKNSSTIPLPARTLVLDNGAYNLKAGFSQPGTDPATVSQCHTIPNCIARDRDRKIYVGSSLDECKDFSELALRRPVEKGYIVNWECQKEIWEHEFFDKSAPLHCEPRETGLILTEAPNALPQLQANCDQIVFEGFGFQRVYRTVAPSLVAYNDIQNIFKPSVHNVKDPPEAAEIVLIIDSGYSHTTITPVLRGQPLQGAIRRLDVGGKHLTNHLTRLVSARKYDMTMETYLMNQVKEACCYVTQDFKTDIEKMWKGTIGEKRADFTSGAGIAKDYVLPDYHHHKEGFIRDHDPTLAGKSRILGTSDPTAPPEEVLTLRNERFTVPELLFSPMDIGIRQPGIPQLVMQSLAVLPIGLWPALLANIIVVGGNANIEGFVQRLQSEITSLAPDPCHVRVKSALAPGGSAWLGGAMLAKNEELLASYSVTRQEYEEHGSAWTSRRFAACLPGLI